MTEQYFEANRRHWDDVVPVHVQSRGYDLEGFLRGEKSVYPLEQNEVGDVRGKSLLHLQCHFGLDTLSWARLGARVTGLDFSEPAIEQARAIAEQVGISDARFVQANVYDAAEVLSEQFDVVYTGIGAICWLPDIGAWAKVVARLLAPGGFVYLYDGHPVLFSLDDEREDWELVLRFAYFETEQPQAWENESTYVDGPPLSKRTTYEWNHSLGEIVSALIDAGLRLDFLHEHREMPWQGLTWMTPDADTPEGTAHARRVTWRLPDHQRDLLPLMFSLKATKPAGAQ